MIVLPRSVARLALRQSSRIAPRVLSATAAPRTISFAYHSYSLPSTAPASPRSDDIPEKPITQAEPLPRVHETRPPPASPAPQEQQPVQQQQKPQPAEKEAAAVTVAKDVVDEAAQPKPKGKATRPRSKLRARKAAMTLTPAAVEQLRLLLDSPDPKLIKVGVKNRGCSGLAYHLQYVEKPGAFDETVEQDGVKVLIDSKALFSIIGSEMDWAEDKLSQRFVFRNPNIKEECGCGESFMV